MLTSACRASNSVAAVTTAAMANATAPRFSIYTAEEQEAAITTNLAYAPIFGPLPTASVNKDQSRLANAFSAVYGDIGSMNSSKPWDRVTMAVGVASEDGVRPRMAPDPTTGRMTVLPIDNTAVNTVANVPTFNAQVSGQSPKSLFESVTGVLSRAKRGLAAETPLVMATASLSTSATASVAAVTSAVNSTSDDMVEETALSVHASTSEPTTATSLENNAPVNNSTSLDATRYDFMPRELRTLPVESCTPLWRMLLLNQHDADLTYIAYNGGAHA